MYKSLQHFFPRLFSLAIFTTISIHTFALTCTCTTAVPSLWSNPAIWSCGRVPLAIDNVVISNVSDVTLVLPFAQCTGLEVQAGGTFNVAGAIFQVSGNIILNGDVNGASLITVGFPGSATTLSGLGTFTAIGTINILGDMDILAGTDISMIGGDLNLADNIGGPDPVVTNFGVIRLGPANLKAAGVDCMFDNRNTLRSGSEVFVQNGGKGKLEASTAGNIVIYQQSGNQAIKPPESSYYHLYFETSNIKSLSADVDVNGDLKIDGSTQFDPSGFDVDVAGHWNNISTNGDPFVEAGSDVTFDGTAAQSITSNIGETFEDLIINNTSATGVTLNDDIRVDNALSLVDGNLYTSAASLLSISDGATSSSGSAASFVDGPMRKEGNDIFTFPVGDGTIFARIGMTAPASPAAIFEAEYFDGSHFNTASVDAALNNVSVVEYWNLNRIATGNTVAVTLFWEDGTRSGVNNMGDLKVSYFDGGVPEWNDQGQGGNSGSPAAGSVTSVGAVTTYGSFTLGSSTNGFNPLGDVGGPLPIELIALNAVKEPNGVRINWITATEINNDHYSVERSANGLDFDELVRVPGAGNTTELTNYSYLDQHPLYGISYYRLKQTDFDGTYSYTETVTVRNDMLMAAGGVKLFPNPVVSGENFNIALPDGSSVEGEEVLIILADVTGREVFSKLVVFEKNGSKIAVDVNDQLRPGVYMVVASNDDQIVFRERVYILEQ